MRRLPVYLLLDTSESMIGPAYDGMTDGVADMYKVLKRDPYALESAALSFITFDSSARLLTPLTELCELIVPGFTLRSGGTALGAAFTMLADQIDKEVVKTTREVKGDHRPRVFLLTDGEPTDDWKPAYEAFREKFGRNVLVYGISCGPDVNEHILKECSDEAYRFKYASPSKRQELYDKLFKMLSSSICSVSQGVGNEKLTTYDDVLPEGIELIGDDVRELKTFPYPRTIFFHGMCSTTRKTSIIRFTLDEDTGCYEDSEAYEMPDNIDISEGDEQPSVPIEILVAPFPDCPCCGNERFLRCGGCRTWYCEPSERKEVSVCPACGYIGKVGGFRSGAQISGTSG